MCGFQMGFEPAKPDDGLLEIVGLRDGWHAAFVMISALTAIRLCQVTTLMNCVGNHVILTIDHHDEINVVLVMLFCSTN